MNIETNNEAIDRILYRLTKRITSYFQHQKPAHAFIAKQGWKKEYDSYVKQKQHEYQEKFRQDIRLHGGLAGDRPFALMTSSPYGPYNSVIDEPLEQFVEILFYEIKDFCTATSFISEKGHLEEFYNYCGSYRRERRVCGGSGH